MKQLLILTQSIKLLGSTILIVFLGWYSHPCIARDSTDIFLLEHGFMVTKNIEQLKQYRQRPQLDKGIFLIAGQSLDDPNFSKTVILITDYSADGTAGLVINRQTKVPVIKALPKLEKLMPATEHLYLGGPVDTNIFSLLAESDIDLPSTQAKHIFSNVYIIVTIDLLDQLIREKEDDQSFKMYVGYAGWAPGQLETELLRGDWYLWHANKDTIFNKAPDTIWNELINRVSAKWVMFNN
ncbi:MAG: YqgE/AlgH family protein [Gammaproteobacteria bacterium]